MPRINHIALKVTDLEAATEFYENVYGFRQVKTGRSRGRNAQGTRHDDPGGASDVRPFARPALMAARVLRPSSRSGSSERCKVSRSPDLPVEPLRLAPRSQGVQELDERVVRPVETLNTAGVLL